MPARVARTRPRLAFPVERFQLANGLRVVVSPDHSAPVVVVAVYYDVGFRSEPEGRTGFAHLFEHLMFEGSAHLDKLEHGRLVQGNGGEFNGSTAEDFTNYFEILPAGALELGLFLEADRMLGVRLDEETLANQIAVVKEEIRVNVLNRPYGGFPWIHLPPVLFRTFNNAHNGYGSFVDLEAATLDDAAGFFERYYAPANAVLAVVGDADPDTVRRLVELHFGSVPGRTVPPRPSWWEPLPDGERRAVHHDELAPAPAVAIASRVPDPVDAMDEYVPTVVLAHVLAGGEASRLHQRLVKRDRLATHVSGSVSLFDAPFDVRDPTVLSVVAFHHEPAEVDGLLAALDQEVAAVAERVEPEELERVVNAMSSAYLRRIDNRMFRGLTSAVLEQQRGRAELLNELPARWAEVTPSAVASAAERWVLPARRAVLEWRPAPRR
ncbi:MAG TPA: pitrilysin family protein [Acidimicrobiales bacterium]|nr:pitrilysin family protein [Acidimicrobiales bacterium]